VAPSPKHGCSVRRPGFAYGHGIGDIFLYVAPVALIAFLITLFIKEVPLSASSGLAKAAETEPAP
jgi:hypothetical protein